MRGGGDGLIPALAGVTSSLYPMTRQRLARMGASTKRVHGGNAVVSLTIGKSSASLDSGMRENRVTDAREDGCGIACCEACLGGISQVRKTRRPT